MARIDTALGEVGAFDSLATLDSPVHRLDPRAKLFATAGFLATVVSFPKYEVAGLMPLCLYPAALLALGRVPPRLLLRYLLIALPFAAMVGLFNPLLDRTIVARLGPLALTGGWLSFLSILARATLTVSAAMLLLATTGYVRVCAALASLRAPRVLVTQFLLLYRFIFVLVDEAARVVRAHELRSRAGRGATIHIWGSLAGHLLLRAHDRGVRLHAAMLSRGFDGTLHPARGLRWSWADSLFIAGCGAFFALARFAHPAERLGRLVLGLGGPP